MLGGIEFVGTEFLLPLRLLVIEYCYTLETPLTGIPGCCNRDYWTFPTISCCCCWLLLADVLRAYASICLAFFYCDDRPAPTVLWCSASTAFGSRSLFTMSSRLCDDWPIKSTLVLKFYSLVKTLFLFDLLT